MNIECVTEMVSNDLPEAYDIGCIEMDVLAELMNLKMDERIFYYTTLIYDLGFKRGIECALDTITDFKLKKEESLATN